jgi:hypothetical protein
MVRKRNMEARLGVQRVVVPIPDARYQRTEADLRHDLDMRRTVAGIEEENPEGSFVEPCEKLQ